MLMSFCCVMMIRMLSVFVSMKRHKESGCGYGYGYGDEWRELQKIRKEGRRRMDKVKLRIHPLNTSFTDSRNYTSNY